MKNIRYFLFPWFVFLVIGATLILLSSKDELHLFFNAHHNNIANTIFYYVTILGNGWTAIVVSIALLFVRYRFAFITALSYGISSGITQALKHFVFTSHDRPTKVFESNHSLYLVPGVDNNFYYSFPSGHSTTAFALYFCLALFTNNKQLKFLCFVFALLASYSRVYLSQHFFEDIYAGSVIGVATTFCIFLIVKPNEDQNQLDKSLFDFRFSKLTEKKPKRES